MCIQNLTRISDAGMLQNYSKNYLDRFNIGFQWWRKIALQSPFTLPTLHTCPHGSSTCTSLKSPDFQRKLRPEDLDFITTNQKCVGQLVYVAARLCHWMCLQWLPTTFKGLFLVSVVDYIMALRVEVRLFKRLHDVCVCWIERERETMNSWERM